MKKLIKANLIPAISELNRSLDVMKTNAPINRKEGNQGQSALEDTNAKSFTGAVKVLTRHQAILDTIKKMHRKHKEK